MQITEQTMCEYSERGWSGNVFFFFFCFTKSYGSMYTLVHPTSGYQQSINHTYLYQ